MTCEPEKVTGYVDGVLEDAEREAIEQHLRSCPPCQEQAQEERELRRRLATLRGPEPSETLEPRVRRQLRGPRRTGPWRWLLPLAASLAAVAVWAHGAAGVLAWQLAWDHDHCYGKPTLPAKVWTPDPMYMGLWLEEQGTPAPMLPERAAGLELVGGRRCPLLGRRVGHVYYTARDRRLSLFVVPGWVRLDRSRQVSRGDKTVRLLRAGGAVVGLVSEDADTVEAFERALTTTVAWGRLQHLLEAAPSAD